MLSDMLYLGGEGYAISGLYCVDDVVFESNDVGWKGIAAGINYYKGLTVP